MIISSGWAKGLALKTPRGDTTRPTAARVRGAILNMVMPWLEDALILDLFGGSGAIGIEAVSRGGRGAVFIERDPAALAAIRPNVEELARRARTQEIAVTPLEVIAGDLADLITRERTLSRWGAFDLIFADPPYADAKMWAEVLLPRLPTLLQQDGILVFETSGGETPKALLELAPRHGWDVLKQKTYGDTMVTVMGRTS